MTINTEAARKLAIELATWADDLPWRGRVLLRQSSEAIKDLAAEVDRLRGRKFHRGEQVMREYGATGDVETDRVTDAIRGEHGGRKDGVSYGD